MKELLFLLLFILISSNEEICDVTKESEKQYNGTMQSLIYFNITKLSGNKIDITYEINDNNSFIDTTIKYIFTNDDPNSNIKLTEKKECDYENKNNNEMKLTYRFKTNNYKYLVLQNLQSISDTKIKIKIKISGNKDDDKNKSKAIVPIIIISIILVAGIVVAFIFVGKYIFNKRQKELMGNYASSFVAENSDLVPNEENQVERVPSSIKIDD